MHQNNSSKWINEWLKSLDWLFYTHWDWFYLPFDEEKSFMTKCSSTVTRSRIPHPEYFRWSFVVLVTTQQIFQNPDTVSSILVFDVFRHQNIDKFTKWMSSILLCCLRLSALTCALIYYVIFRKKTASSFALLVGSVFVVLYRIRIEISTRKSIVNIVLNRKKHPMVKKAKWREFRWQCLMQNKNELTKKITSSCTFIPSSQLYTYCHSLCPRNNWFDPFYSIQS